MARKLVIPDPDPALLPEPGQPVEMLFIDPEGATPGREVAGFFIITFDGVPVMPDRPVGNPDLPRQFLTLDAVNAYVRERSGQQPPLRVRHYVRLDRAGAKDFPVIWGGERRIDGRRVTVEARYLGSFYYWDGRRVDPTKVGTRNEFN